MIYIIYLNPQHDILQLGCFMIWINLWLNSASSMPARYGPFWGVYSHPGFSLYGYHSKKEKEEPPQRGAKNWVKGDYHGGNQLIWGNFEWADAPGMPEEDGRGCTSRRTVRWATSILASNGKAEMAMSIAAGKTGQASYDIEADFHVCMYIQNHPESKFLASWYSWIMR